MGHIKSVLKEELENSKKMKRLYEEKLLSLPKGSLSVMKRRGIKYCYVKYREGNSVKNDYMGKYSKELDDKYKKVKQQRKKLLKMLTVVKKQIRFIKGAVRGKESV